MDILRDHIEEEEIEILFQTLFRNRGSYFKKYGYTKKAFEKSNHINAKAWLTPGFMGNPPDRLDGFHDYHFECRKRNDPGRTDANLKSYVHDRRSFEYWTEGDWMAADTLYNMATEGYCEDCPSGTPKVKISPDHIGPISCGFKQMPFFKPLCSHHNSAKNRRFTFQDTKLLILREEELKDSVVSFQVRSHWDLQKQLVKNDEHSKILSNSLRSLQDCFFRIIFRLWEQGYARFICSLLSPELAFNEVEFKDADGSKLTFSSYSSKKKTTPNRESLFRRSIRIALESLQEYQDKDAASRKLLRKDYDLNKAHIDAAIQKIVDLGFTEEDNRWRKLLPSEKKIDAATELTLKLLTKSNSIPKQSIDGQRFEILEACMNKIGEVKLLEESQ